MPKKVAVEKMEVVPEMDKYFLGSLKKCFTSPNFHNTKFLVGLGAQEFHVNSTVLGIISPVFRELLFKTRRPQSSKKGNCFELPDITPTGFSALVRFGFTLDPEITPENVIEVIHAAQLYKVFIIHRLAIQYVDKVLTEAPDEYFVPFLESAARYGLGEIVRKCFDSFQNNAGGVADFLKSKQFLEFPAEFVTLLLKCDELALEESAVWDAVQAWAKTQARRNKTEIVYELKKVYHFVRFPLMDTAYFTANVVPLQVLTQKEMLDIFCYLTYPEGKPSTEPFSSKPRFIWTDKQVSRYSKVGGDWFHLQGYVDAIGLSVDRTCQLTAVGTFAGEGLTKSRVTIYKGQGESRELLSDTKELSIHTEKKSQDPIKLDLSTPVTLKKGEVYELEINQIGPCSFKLKDGKSSNTESHNGLDMTFSWLKPKVETENTLKKGNIPCLWVRVLSGMN